MHDTSSIGLFPLWVSYLQQNFFRRAWDLFHRTFPVTPETSWTGILPSCVRHLQQDCSSCALGVLHRTLLTVRDTSSTGLFSPYLEPLLQTFPRRSMIYILQSFSCRVLGIFNRILLTGLKLIFSLFIYPGHDHSWICSELRHLIRKWVKTRSLTTWMKFHARLPLSLPMTLPTFFSIQGTDADSSVTLSLTTTKYIANRLIRISIRIGRGETSPSPPSAHPVWWFQSYVNLPRDLRE